MKKILGTFTLLLVMAFAVNAQGAPATTDAQPDPNAPEITFDEETIDYGTLDKGANGVRHFKFTNTGKTPLIIYSCKGSCGCTVPKCPTEPINPGETGDIEVKYDTNRPGPFNKTVTVKSNAKNATVYLKIKGKINAETGTAFPAKGTEGGPVE